MMYLLMIMVVDISLGHTTDSLLSSFNAGQQYTTDADSSLPAENIPGYAGVPSIDPNVAPPLASPIAEVVKTESTFSYTLDPKTDPLFKQADEIVANPESAVDVTPVDVPADDTTVTTHTCEEGGIPTYESCRMVLTPKQVGENRVRRNRQITILFSDFFVGPWNTWAYKVLVQRRDCTPHFTIPTHDSITHERFLFTHQDIVSARFAGWGRGPNYKLDNWMSEKNVVLDIVVNDRIPIFELVWEATCQTLEAHADAGRCTYEREICRDTVPSKNIQGISLTAPCWVKDRIYRCERPSQNTCTPLRQQGCFQISSVCAQEVDGTCVMWRQTYQCGQRSPKRCGVAGVKKPFCLDGDCHKIGFAPNTDMAASLSKLSILNGLQKEGDAKLNSFFKGKVYRCVRNPVNFRDCCGLSGWGSKIGLVGCGEEAKELADNRQHGLCVFVGTYCSKKVMKVCVEKKSSFCCFPSKLSRLIHEQGRPHIGRTWGSAEHPDASGFTSDELTRLNFDKIDLSELFREIEASVRLPNPPQFDQKHLTNKENPDAF